MMGGFGAHEYMAPCPAGENDVALAPGYAANVEVASAEAQPVQLPPSARPRRRRCRRPGMTTIDAVAGHLGVPAGALLKAFPVVTDDRGLVMVVVRGDHRVNEIKLQNALGAAFRAAHPDEVSERIGPPGFIGPVGDRPADPPRRGRRARRLRRRRQPARRAHRAASSPAATSASTASTCARSRRATASNGHVIRIEPAIEVGNIFKLGTRYSEPLGATYLDESGTRAARLDGLLRHRPGAHRRGGGRAVRRRARASPGRARSRRGTSSSWRSASPGTPEREAAEKLYEELAPRASTSCSTTATPGRARSSPTPSCSACPLRLTLGKPLAGVGRGRGADPPRARRTTRRRPARGRRGGGGRAVAQPPVDRAREAAAEQVEKPASPSAACQRPRPLGPAAAGRRCPARRGTSGRSRTGSASSASRSSRCSSCSALTSETGPTPLPAVLFAVDRLGRLRRRHRRARDRPVQPLRRAARPGRRPPARHQRRRRSAGTSSCCRAGRSPSSLGRELFMLAAGRSRCTAASS